MLSRRRSCDSDAISRQRVPQSLDHHGLRDGATLMQALDTTIANVALPYMQGSLSATLRPDHLGADLLHHRRGDHDRAGRLAGRALRPQEPVHHRA